MPNGNMTIHSIIRLLGGSVLVIFVSVLAGCAGVGTGESADVGGERASSSKTSATAQPSSGKSVSTQAGAGSSAEAKEKKAEPVQLFKGSGVLLKPPGPEKVSAEPANVSLNFEAADIRDIAKTVLAEILQESYIVDPRVQGSITFVLPGPCRGARCCPRWRPCCA